MQRLRAGEKTSEVLALLSKNGLDPTRAAEMVRRNVSLLRSQGMQVIIVGVAMVVAGAVISFILTEVTQGMYWFLLWGPILGGLVAIIVGIARLVRCLHR